MSAKSSILFQSTKLNIGLINNVLFNLLVQLSSKDEPFETQHKKDLATSFTKKELMDGLELFLDKKLCGISHRDMYEICISNTPLFELQQVKIPVDSLFFECAAANGRLDLVKWQYSPLFNRTIAERAAFGGHTHILEWLEKKGERLVWCENLCTLAANGGNLETLKFLREHSCFWGQTVYIAICFGYEEIAHWAMENGCPKDSFIHYIEGDRRIERLRDTILYKYRIPPFLKQEIEEEEECFVK